ncbi:MAG: lysophospholipid acyltransferase family protein [SAR86 cluster bacterium]|jgi:1-acyl-sn-glycerol-3-phosphate acyltransferase|nr:lysophospholipid acyltransferase family protein [SAR86 cluster bacterium]
MIFLRSFIFYIGYLVSGFIAGFFATFIGPFISLERRLKIFSMWPLFANWYLGKTCNIKVIIEGKENITNKPCIIVSNHQGQWETFFFQYLFFPLCTLLKKELLFIPFWGWAMKQLEPIAIDRKKPNSALKTILKEGEKRLNNNMFILFFPEGTRMPAGEVKKYSRSGFELALKTNIPILPVVHNSGDCWPAHRFLKRPGTIKIRIGKSLLVSNTKKAAIEIENWTRINLKEIRGLES